MASLDFSLITSDPNFQAVVNQGIIESRVRDTLFPALMFRERYMRDKKADNEGVDGVVSASGLIAPNGAPVKVGTEPDPVTNTFEQWTYLIRRYFQTTDIAMPTSLAAAFSTFSNTLDKMAKAAGQTLNRLARNGLYNAAMSGNTVTVGSKVISGTSTAALPVARLNGFTTARRPGVAGASLVKFDQVSSSNPLPITISGMTNVYVVGYTATVTLPNGEPDQTGPGTLSLVHDSVSTTLSARTAVLANDRTTIQRSGGGDSIDALGGSDLFSFADLQAGVARMETNDVPRYADGNYAMDLAIAHKTEIFADDEFQILYRGRGTNEGQNRPYQKFVIAELFGITFYQNNESPRATNVTGASAAGYSEQDRFGGEMYVGGTTSGAEVRRSILSGAECGFEKYVDVSHLLSESGSVIAKTMGVVMSANAIRVIVDEVLMIIRAPIGKAQDDVAVSWMYEGDFFSRTDACSGDSQRYKRVQCFESV